MCEEEVKYKVYHSHHRLDYIMQSKFAYSNFKPGGNTPIDKSACLMNSQNLIIIEYTDGVFEGQENPDWAKKTLEAVKKTLNPGDRKIFYVRPACSLVQQKDLRTYLESQGVTLLNCLPWSYNRRGYQDLLGIREEVRKSTNLRPSEPGFIGTVSGTHGPHKVRSQKISCFDSKYQTKTRIYTKAWDSDFIQAVISHRLLLQPVGAGVRHNIYEGFMLGTPSVVEKTTYLSNMPSDIFVIDDFVSDSTCDRISKILTPGDSSFEEIRQKAMDFFETRMLPDAIIKDVIDQVDQLS